MVAIKKKVFKPLRSLLLWEHPLPETRDATNIAKSSTVITGFVRVLVRVYCLLSTLGMSTEVGILLDDLD